MHTDQLWGRRHEAKPLNIRRPPSAGDTACQTKLRILQTLVRLQSLGGPRLCRRPLLKVARGHALSRLRLNFCRFWPDFLPIKNSSKIRPLKKSPKISKMRPPSAPMQILTSFWDAFWHPFSSKIAPPRKRVFCDKYRAGVPV